ncbi:MAG: rhomboid family intramembrane serine protease [Sphingobacteriia bacterium]|nr:rhomboid family intramembrane serine protease [Sphingobacteriia bacterium]
MHPYQNPLDDIRHFFSRKSILPGLIIINTGIFIIVQLFRVFFWLFQVKNPEMAGGEVSWISYYLSVPASFEQLVQRPWTIFTYMFLHEGFFHLLFNMIVLYFGGRIFMEYLDKRKLLSVYILGGLTGAVFYIAAFNFFPVFSSSVQYSIAMGASASVLAILIAVATYVPEYSIILFLFGRIKLKYLALILVLIDLLSIPQGNAGGHIAHLGGAFWGFLYIFLLKKGSDLSVSFHWMNFQRLHWPKRRSKKSAPPYTARPLSDEEYNERRRIHQERIDRILEKISRSGYSSLTKEEKALLFQSSHKNNRQ